MRVADYGGGTGLEDVEDGFPLQGRWSDGLFACFRQFKPTCLMATCCSCILISQIAERVRCEGGGRHGGARPCRLAEPDSRSCDCVVGGQGAWGTVR